MKIPSTPVDRDIRSSLCQMCQCNTPYACGDIDCDYCVFDPQNWKSLVYEEREEIAIKVVDLFNFVGVEE